MTDRELLELAAKAYGAGQYPETGTWEYFFERTRPGEDDFKDWNSLADDGDAFRLMVDKRFTVKVEDHEVEVFDEWGECLVSIGMQTDEDYRAATRLAITRAAAEIQLQRERNEKSI